MICGFLGDGAMRNIHGTDYVLFRKIHSGTHVKNHNAFTFFHCDAEIPCVDLIF